MQTICEKEKKKENKISHWQMLYVALKRSALVSNEVAFIHIVSHHSFYRGLCDRNTVAGTAFKLCVCTIHSTATASFSVSDCHSQISFLSLWFYVCLYARIIYFIGRVSCYHYHNGLSCFMGTHFYGLLLRGFEMVSQQSCMTDDFVNVKWSENTIE